MGAQGIHAVGSTERATSSTWRPDMEGRGWLARRETSSSANSSMAFKGGKFSCVSLVKFLLSVFIHILIQGLSTLLAITRVCYMVLL